MDIQQTKQELIKLILNLDNAKIINKLWEILKNQDEDFWIELSREEKDEIRLGLHQLDQGEGITLEEFMKKVS